MEILLWVWYVSWYVSICMYPYLFEVKKGQKGSSFGRNWIKWSFLLSHWKVVMWYIILKHIICCIYNTDYFWGDKKPQKWSQWAEITQTIFFRRRHSYRKLLKSHWMSIRVKCQGFWWNVFWNFGIKGVSLNGLKFCCQKII